LPLSHVIGINYYIAQFEDFVIRTKYAYEYHELINKAKKSMLRDSSEIDHLISVLENYRKYPNELITGRIKSPYSVFKKVYVRNEPLENITDYVALRIITKNEDDCYSWMGHIFANWTPVIGKIKDYIEHQNQMDINHYMQQF
jgi:GTP pyrophosphokinase